MTINWWTLALQAINFLVLVWLLQRFLYRPVQAVIAKRKVLVEQAFDEAERAQRDAATAREGFENDRAELARSRQELLQTTHSELAAERQQMIESARAEANALLDGARQQVARERDAALVAIKAELADTAMAMATTLLEGLVAGADGGPLGPALADAFLEQVLERLDGLPPTERQTLVGDLRGSTEPLRIVTAAALDEGAQQRWRKALGRALASSEAAPSTPDIEFDVDAGLLGGAELRFPHAVLSLAWSAQLRLGRDALIADDVAR